jgi:hypothetical protein
LAGNDRRVHPATVVEPTPPDLDSSRAGANETALPAAALSVSDPQLLQIIGSGSSGEVWLARNKLGTRRAVKIVYRAAFDNARPFEREFKGIQKFEPISRSNEGLCALQQWPPREVARVLRVSVAQVYLAKHRIARLFKAELKRLETRTS